MRKLRFWIINVLIASFVMLIANNSYSQAKMKLDTIYACKGDTIKVPIKASNLASVGSISAVFDFNPLVLSFLSTTVKPILNSGFTSTSPTSPPFVLSWYSTNPLFVVYDSLIIIKFIFHGGSTSLTWDMGSCDMTNVPGVSLPSIWINGLVTDVPKLAHINSDPVNVTECVGDTVSFHITSNNTTFIQWQVSSNNGATWNDLSPVAPYSGVFTNDLTISGITLAMNNNLYRCRVRGQCPVNQVPDVISDSAKLFVNGPPVVFAGNDFGICTGLSANLTGTASSYVSINWTYSGSGTITGNGTLTPTYTPSPADTVAGSVNFYLNAVALAGCNAKKDSMLLTIYPTPLAKAGNDTTICIGDIAYLHGAGGTSYLWSTTPVQSSQVAVVNPVVTTTYTLTVHQNGCSSSDAVTVNVIPVPVISAGLNDTICAGQTVSLNGTAINYSSVLWLSSGNGSFADSSALSTIYTPSAADITAGLVELYLTVVPNSPCTNIVTDTLLLVIRPIPHVSAGIDKQICIGDTATLVATGANTYVWNTVPAQTNDTILVNPQVTAYYVVTGTAAICSAVDSVKVVVNMLPNLNAGNDTIICFGTSATLMATGGISYIWSTGSPTPFVTVSPTVTTTYTVTATGTFNCKATDAVVVIVNSNLTASILPQYPVICAGDSVQLVASANLPVSYTWSPPMGLSATNVPVVMASPYMTTNYEVLVKDNNLNCTTTATITVTVNQNPIVQVHPSAITICEEDTISLVAYGALHYYWSPPTGLSSNTLPSVLASPMDSISYLIIGTDANGCVDSFRVNVNVNRKPRVNLPGNTIICNGTNYLLDAGAYLDSCNYKWQDGSDQQFFYASTPGTYTVVVSKLGCYATDSTVIYPCSELFVPNAFSPNNDGVNDMFYVINSGDVVKFHMVIYNRWGESVFQTYDINEGWDGNYNGQKSPVGVYHWVIEYLGQGNVLLEQEGKQYGQITLFR